MSGTWRAQGIYEHLLFARYDEQGHFSPHTGQQRLLLSTLWLTEADGYTILDFNRRSYYTVIVYLNDCADGGTTAPQGLSHIPVDVCNVCMCRRRYGDVRARQQHGVCARRARALPLEGC